MTGHIRVRSAHGSRLVAVDDYVDARAEEQAQHSSHAWIKELRRVVVDDQPFRDRFSVRGDSMWWFSELYLHRQRVILDLHRTIAAVDTLIERERPLELTVVSGPPLLRHVTAWIASARDVRSQPPPRELLWWRRLARLDLRARRFNFLARATAARWKRGPAGPTDVAAFVHRAFWTSGASAREQQPYVGRVLQELERRLGPGGVNYVGIGPAANYRARRWWKRARAGSAVVTPVERFAPIARLDASQRMWRARYEHLRLLLRSAGLRRAAIIRGVDCWPLVREQLAGIAWLQWPWSARAMDEAAAALDALRPRLVLTYAEAGGWGRALVLEARRRNIPSVGLQHGFIYRHWLNYLHEEDEMRDGVTPAFPAPTITLVFDHFAARHLRENGRLPEKAIEITGSPHRDDLIRTIRALSPGAVQEARRTIGVPAGMMIVLLTTKEREARSILPALVAAVAGVGGAWLVIKPHPAETAEAYESHVAGRQGVTVVRPGFPLAPLLAACRAVVTVNSTVVLDASAAGIPGLVVGLPNNLTPFVEAGALAGAWPTEAFQPALHRILYDESFREQLIARQRAAFEADSAPVLDAAAGSAGTILDLLGDPRERHS